MNCNFGPSVKVVVTSDTGGDLQLVFGDGSEGGVKDAHWGAQIEVFSLYLPFVNKDCFIFLRWVETLDIDMIETELRIFEVRMVQNHCGSVFWGSVNVGANVK